MIVPEDRKASTGETIMPSRDAEGPPPYDEVPPQPPSGSSSSAVATRVPYRPRPENAIASNFVRIRRKDSSVKGVYVIDPWLRVPDEVLAAPTEDEDKGKWCKDSLYAEADDSTRKNLYIESKNCSVAADIWLVDEGEVGGPRDPTMEGKRAELELKSYNDSVKVKLESTTTRPFALTAYSRHGYVSVAIPPDFVGPVTITAVNYYVSLPGSMKERLVTFSEEKGTRHCFIGDFKKAGYTGRQSWTGSTIDVGSHNCKVTLYFVNEEKTVGLWHKLFGGWL